MQYINEDDQEVLPVSTKKETEKNIPASETIEDSMQIDQEDEGELGFEVILHQGNLDLERASNTQENNSADVVQCHNASRLERVCSFSYALDPCSSPNKDDIVEKPLKITEFDMGFTFSTTVQILKVEDNPALSQNLSRSRSSVKRKRETIPRTNDSSEEESDSAVSYEDIDDAVIPVRARRNPKDDFVAGWIDLSISSSCLVCDTRQKKQAFCRSTKELQNL